MRCESHVLLAGLAVSDNQRVHICENRLAVVVIERTRDRSSGQRQTRIRYGDVHRVELRSLLEHMIPGGSF